MSTNLIAPTPAKCSAVGCERPQWVQPHYVSFRGDWLPVEPQVSGWTLHAMCFEHTNGHEPDVRKGGG